MLLINMDFITNLGAKAHMEMSLAFLKEMRIGAQIMLIAPQQPA